MGKQKLAKLTNQATITLDKDESLTSCKDDKLEEIIGDDRKAKTPNEDCCVGWAKNSGTNSGEQDAQQNIVGNASSDCHQPMSNDEL